MVDDEEWFKYLHSSSFVSLTRADSCALNLTLAESSSDANCHAFPQNLIQNKKTSIALPEREDRKQHLAPSSNRRVMKKPSLIARKAKTEPEDRAEKSCCKSTFKN